MKILTKIITKCEECTNIRFTLNKHSMEEMPYCDHSYLKVDINETNKIVSRDTIPKWCPLENAKN